ncbi:PREDICTED: cytochrome c oxidase assembly protein COX16 homolog, mitochondrial [Eurypyga helias]|uniref:cytochrome c oxidase assembly protein COX16 homolog, mitochondrial n=1 Tax=Eurypyga helias TaxID=54383 RepID=UPI0005280BFF|nr:PREDICTED: cytochrome c oxidase assembly protein COX16 homolog, mitochondrial [Eurypyga helias]
MADLVFNQLQRLSEIPLSSSRPNRSRLPPVYTSCVPGCQHGICAVICWHTSSAFECNSTLYLVGGSFGLREFAQIRYDVYKLHGKVDPALKEKLKQNTATLESEYEKLDKSDLDNWENIRGPRLWEDSRAVQKQRREALHLKAE